MRKPDRYEQFLIACTADIRGRPGYEKHPYPQADYYREALKIIRSVDIQPFKDAGLQGKEMANAIHTARQSALNNQLVTTENI